MENPFPLNCIIWVDFLNDACAIVICLTNGRERNLNLETLFIHYKQNRQCILLKINLRTID